MRDTWLHIALMASVLGWCPSWFGWFWIIGCVCWLWRLQHIKVMISIMLFVVLQLRFYPVTTSQPADIQLVEVVEIKSTYVIAQSDAQKVILYNVGDVSFQDVIEVKGVCEPIHSTQNFHVFNFADWAKRRGIGYGCNIEQVTKIKEGNTARARLYRSIQTMEEGPRIWLLKTLYGIQEESEQTVSYLVSSSGMHLSYLAHLLQVLLTLWLPSILAEGLSLGAILWLGSVTVMKDALQRILFFRLASFTFQKESVHDRLGIAMLSLLLMFPYMAQELSYVLPVMFRLVYLFHVRKRNKRILSMGVLLPIQFSYFNEVDIVSLIMFPMLRKLYAFVYFLAIGYLLVPTMLFYEVAQGILTLCNYISCFHLSLYYHAGFWFVWVWFYLLFRYISHQSKKSGWLLLVMVGYAQVSPYLRPYMEIMMLDVGQGDCTLISLPFNQGNILLDVAGNPYKNITEDIIVPALHAKGIRSLDYVIITHDDYDHSGGLGQLQELMEVDAIIQDKQESLYVDDARFEFLMWEHTYEDKNENSIVTFLEIYGLRFIFMGDAGKKVERDILVQYPNIEADIIKVGHHGSRTSSDVEFLHQLHPQLALISCGFNNRYGHPSYETIESLSNENVHALNTAKEGAVSIKLTNFVRFYNTATHEFGIIKIR